MRPSRCGRGCGFLDCNPNHFGPTDHYCILPWGHAGDHEYVYACRYDAAQRARRAMSRNPLPALLSPLPPSLPKGLT